MEGRRPPLVFGPARHIPIIERVGRFVYRVQIRTEWGPDGFPGVELEQPPRVLGARWARWKARRMLRAKTRYDCA